METQTTPDILNSVPKSEAEADALLSAIEGTPAVESEEPEAGLQSDGEKGIEASQQGSPQQTAEEIANQLFKLNWKGQVKEFPLDQFTRYAQQGYDYSQNMQGINQQRARLDFEQKQLLQEREKYKGLESRLNEYREIEDYLQKDPAWWQFVRESYAQRQKEQGNPSTPYMPVIQELSKKVEDLSGNLSSVLQEKEIARQAELDTALAKEISEYQEKYSDFDWKTLDGEGLDLERRIIRHALDNGIQTFRAAANDYLHEEFVKRAGMKAKEETGKKIQEQTKKGLGPITDKPQTQEFKRVKNVRDKSWDDITSEALAELGLA